jgi:hypothetical protein
MIRSSENSAPMSTGNAQGPGRGATKAPAPDADWKIFSPSSSSSSDSLKGAGVAHDSKQSSEFVDGDVHDAFEDSLSSDVEADQGHETRGSERYDQ